MTALIQIHGRCATRGSTRLISEIRIGSVGLSLKCTNLAMAARTTASCSAADLASAKTAGRAV